MVEFGQFETSDFEMEVEEVEVKKISKFDRVWSASEGGSIVRTILVDNRLYWGAFDGYLYALNIDNKKLIWKTKLGNKVDSSPVHSEGLLYIGARNGNFFCVDADTGKIIWRYRMGDAMAGLAGCKDGMVYTSSKDANFYAFDAKTGKLVWRFRTGESNCCAPGFYKNAVVFGSFDGYVYCLDSRTGKEIWRFRTGAEVFNPVHPEFNGNIVFFPSFDSYLYALDAETGKEVWKSKLGNYGIAMSPTIHMERMYIGARDGNLYCLDMNGKEIWRFMTGKVIESKAVVMKGRIYFGSEDGNLYCVSIDGKEIWRFRVDSEIWDEPKIYNGKIIFGATDCKVHYLDLDTGKETWHIQTSTLRKSKWSHPYEMFRVEIKKETRIEDSVSEDKYKSKGAESVSLSDYHTESEYSSVSDYKQKTKYDNNFMMNEGIGEELWISVQPDSLTSMSSSRISK